MITIGQQNGQTANNLVSLYLDTADDLTSLPTTFRAGSTAYVIATSDVYMLNSSGKWIKQQ